MTLQYSVTFFPSWITVLGGEPLMPGGSVSREKKITSRLNVKTEQITNYGLVTQLKHKDLLKMSNF